MCKFDYYIPYSNRKTREDVAILVQAISEAYGKMVVFKQ